MNQQQIISKLHGVDPHEYGPNSEMATEIASALTEADAGVIFYALRMAYAAGRADAARIIRDSVGSRRGAWLEDRMQLSRDVDEDERW